MFIGCKSSFFFRRAFREKEVGVESPGRKRRSYPTPHIDERARINMHPSLLPQLTRCPNSRFFVRLELSTWKGIEATLKHHSRSATNPEDFKRWDLAD